MSRFIIHGGKPIGGRLRPSGNKNAVLPMMAASLLTDEPVILENAPRIEDVEVMASLLEGLGVSVSRQARVLRLQGGSLRRVEADPALCRRVRGSILLAGPLVARHGRAVVSSPGGDVIGRRRVDTHFSGLSALGVRVQAGDRYRFTCRRLRGASIILDEASVTATENVLMAATLARGRTTIFNAACEPHVSDLARLLVSMGARIQGIGTNYLGIDGVERLGGARHRVDPDHIEMGSYIAASALTGGALEIEDAGEPLAMEVVLRSLHKLGLRWSRSGQVLRIPAGQRLRVRGDYGGVTAKLEDGVWPAFPSDLMSVAVVMATQARGGILFFEKLFESRMYFVDHLIAMGGNIIQCDPHRVVVNGPSPLIGAHLSSPDIRAGMALVVAALAAKGESVIENAQVIDRGYEAVDRRLRSLGADIRREG